MGDEKECKTPGFILKEYRRRHSPNNMSIAFSILSSMPADNYIPSSRSRLRLHTQPRSEDMGRLGHTLFDHQRRRTVPRQSFMQTSAILSPKSPGRQKTEDHDLLLPPFWREEQSHTLRTKFFWRKGKPDVECRAKKQAGQTFVLFRLQSEAT